MAVSLLIVVWIGAAYAVLGGADFGAGILHLFASGRGARREREVIAKAISPVWEANHVWLIFVITGLFSAFPRAFSALGMVAFLPATLVLLGIVARGASLTFAGQIDGSPRGEQRLQRVFGAASVATPLLFGTIAAGVARSGVTAVHGAGSRAFWIGPFQLLVGLLAVALCTTLAACFLTVEARGDDEMAATFRTRAVCALAATGVLAAAALAAARSAAPGLFDGLIHRGLPAVLAAAAALGAALWALRARRYAIARAAAALGAIAIVWGWGLAQYPRLAGGLTVRSAAASSPELTAVAVALAAGAVLLAPALWLLYVAFRRQPIEVTRCSEA